MKKKMRIIVTVCILTTTYLFMLSGCNNNSITLSGNYASVDDDLKMLIFEGNSVSLRENGSEIRSGTYRFHNETLILNWESFSEAYTLDEENNTLFYGSSNHENFGNVAFSKVN